MKNKDPFLLPLISLQKKVSQIKDPLVIWFFIFQRLCQINIKGDQILLLFNNSNLNKLIINKPESDFPFINLDLQFSLDETQSDTHLTPYHLSQINFCLDNQKSKGQFFTPFYISRFISNKSLEYFLKSNPIENLYDIKVADIACGSGNLILPFLFELKSILFENKTFSSEKFSHFLSKNLFGFDLDSFALEICYYRIVFFSSYFFPEQPIPLLKQNLHLGNSLLEYPFDFTSDIQTLTEPINLLATRGFDGLNFDIIISNPPYMCYGLRNAQKYNENYKNFLRDNYFSAEYKLSMYPLFIERSIKLLNKNGILGIITPDSFLLGRYYSKIRNFILKNTQIKEIAMLGFEPFKSATIGRPTISFFQKINNSDHDQRDNYFEASWYESLDKFLKNIDERCTNLQTDFLENDFNRFFLFFNKKSKDILHKWNQETEIKLEDIASIHTGIRSKIGQKKIISKSKKGQTWARGIISSSQVNPFCIYYNNHWINIDPKHLWSGGYDREIIENPKLFIRQTGFNIVTAVDENNYYHLNNVHSLSLKSDEINIYAISTILNSIEFNEIYHILSNEKNRALAQIDIDFISKIRIPMYNRSTIKKLEEFYFKKALNCNSTIQNGNYRIQDII